MEPGIRAAGRRRRSGARVPQPWVIAQNAGMQAIQLSADHVVSLHFCAGQEQS
ncbi:MAG: hypothetical protein ACPGJF_08515 [Sinimarinibacterium flocculans]|uniref:hypothetical protein n=1 Tax=Sinimarinibacterium flocculans TaxID=985250 RepID=UPI003C6203A9